MTLSPRILFYVLGFCFLGYSYSRGTGFNYLNSWIWIGYLNALVVGFLYSKLPELFSKERLKINQWFPVGMLVLFMLVLKGVQARPIAEPLFFTASALMMFRTLLLMLTLLQASSKATPKGFLVLVSGIAVALALNGAKVYSAFHRGLENLNWIDSGILRVLVLSLFLGWSWYRAKPRWALLPGVLLVLIPQTLEWGVFFFGIGIWFEH